MGTGTAKGQLNVCRTGTAYRERTAGTVYWGQSVLSTGTAYLGQAQPDRAQAKRIEDRHRVFRTGTAY